MRTVTRAYNKMVSGPVVFSAVRHFEGTFGLVTVTGEIDMDTAPGLRREIMALLDRGAHDIVVDLLGVTFLDSTALGVLVSGLRQARLAGGDLRLVVRSSHVLRMLAITRLDAVFGVYDSLAAART